MLVPINKIRVEDRIRKDYGNIPELAEDIKENGLINDIVVNKEYKLLAGERRLRACKYLNWEQVEVKMMDTRDAEHELNVEISENENRKEFSKAERVDWMKRLWRIEAAKADERMKAGKAVNHSENSHEGGKTDEITAKQFGISSNTLRREIAIVDNKDLLTPEDFADWDEGKLSTNKAFLKIKAEKEKLEQTVSSLQKKINEVKATVKPAAEDNKAELLDTISNLKNELSAKDRRIKKLEEDTRTFTAADYLERNNVNVYRRLEGEDDIYDLSREVTKLLEDKLAPLKFRRCFETIEVSKNARENLSAMIDNVYNWCQEIAAILDSNTSADEIIVD